MGACGVNPVGLGWGPVEGSCERSDEPSVSGATELVMTLSNIVLNMSSCVDEIRKTVWRDFDRQQNPTESQIVTYGANRIRCYPPPLFVLVPLTVALDADYIGFELDLGTLKLVNQWLHSCFCLPLPS
jgi:hypothetical protein